MKDAIAYSYSPLDSIEDFQPTHHADCKANISTWNYLSDLYGGSKNWLTLSDRGFESTSKTEKYLPQHVAESPENWRSRINSTHFDDLFAGAVRRFVGMIFRGGLNLTEPWDDIDAIDLITGNAESLISQLAIEAMVLGHTFVLVDYPAIAVDDYSEFLGTSPYWVKVSPQQLIDWSTEVINGQVRFSYALIQVVENGETYYYQYSQSRWNKYIELNEKGKITYSWCKGASWVRSHIPLVPLYGGLPLGICESIPPLKAIADKNRTLYQLTSDHYRKMSLCCQPVPVLKDLMREQGDGLEIGPNSFIELRDPNGSFEWKEPLALSLEQSRRDLNDLRESIARDSADFLTQPADRQSASATNLLTHPVESSLSSFIRTFQAGINEAIAEYWTMADRENPPKIFLEANIFPDSTKDSQALFAIQTIFAAELITRDEARVMINNLGFDLDATRE
jgi:hypothetical protein